MHNPRGNHLVIVGIEPLGDGGVAVHVAPDPRHHGAQPQEAVSTLIVERESVLRIRDAVKGVLADG